MGDRNYGQDYQLFGELTKAGVAFVVRRRDEAVLAVLEELPLPPADRAASGLRSAWVRPGCQACYHSGRGRLVWVQTDQEVLQLLTNLSPANSRPARWRCATRGAGRSTCFFAGLKASWAAGTGWPSRRTGRRTAR